MKLINTGKGQLQPRGPRHRRRDPATDGQHPGLPRAPQGAEGPIAVADAAGGRLGSSSPLTPSAARSTRSPSRPRSRPDGQGSVPPTRSSGGPWPMVAKAPLPPSPRRSDRRPSDGRSPRRIRSGARSRPDWLLVDEGRGAFVELAEASGLARLTSDERGPESARAASTRGTGTSCVRPSTRGWSGSRSASAGPPRPMVAAACCGPWAFASSTATGADLPEGGAALAHLSRLDSSGPRPPTLVRPDRHRLRRDESALRTTRRCRNLRAAEGRRSSDGGRSRCCPRRPRPSDRNGDGAARRGPAGRGRGGWDDRRPARIDDRHRSPRCRGRRGARRRGRGARVGGPRHHRGGARRRADPPRQDGVGVATLARSRNTLVVLLCGGLGPGAEALDGAPSLAVVQPILDRPMTLDEAMADTGRLLQGSGHALRGRSAWASRWRLHGRR